MNWKLTPAEPTPKMIDAGGPARVGREQIARQKQTLKDLPEADRQKYEMLIAGLPPQPRGKRGDGWLKVTVGRGGPHYGHRSLPVERVIEEIK